LNNLLSLYYYLFATIVSKRTDVQKTLTLTITVAILAGSLFAAPTNPTSKGDKKSMEHTTKIDLNLTQEQRDKWNAIFQKYKKKAVELQHQQSAEVDAILTPHQRKIIKEENERREAIMTKRLMQEEQKRVAEEKKNAEAALPAQ